MHVRKYSFSISEDLSKRLRKEKLIVSKLHLKNDVTTLKGETCPRVPRMFLLLAENPAYNEAQTLKKYTFIPRWIKSTMSLCLIYQFHRSIREVNVFYSSFIRIGKRSSCYN